jgi:hypothetical protein
VFHYFRDAEVLAQHAAAGDDHGRYIFAVQFRSVKGAIGRVIVVAEDNQGIGLRGWFVHHPELPGEAQQRVPGRVENGEKSEKEQQEKQPEENAAMFAASQAMGSSLRRRSAASSGRMAL